MTSVQNSCTDFTAGHSVIDAHTNEALFRFLRKPLLLNISFTLRASIRAQRGFVRYVHALRSFSSFHVAISRCSETLNVFFFLLAGQRSSSFFFCAWRVLVYLGHKQEMSTVWYEGAVKGSEPVRHIVTPVLQRNKRVQTMCNSVDRVCYFFVFFLLTGDR